VINALGTQSEVGEIQVSFKDITISDLKLNAPAGWPARHMLTAARVVIAPDLGSFTSGLLRINRIRIERATLAVLRDRTGKLRVLPSFNEKVSATGKSSIAAVPASAVLIEAIELKDSTISFFDEEVRSPPLQVNLADVEASITNLRVPELTGTSTIDIKANVSGPTQRGTLAISGHMEFATRDGKINTTLRDVEIAAMEPYLIKAAETGVRKGTLDLDLAANVEAQRLTAPGKLVFKGLELRSSETTANTFMGLPRDAVINLIRQRDGRIEVPFTLEGNLNDPRFALDGAFKARLAIAAAGALGVTVTGLVTELGGLRDKGTAREKVDALRDSLKRLLGR
jgi:uncharacterized protein involved in outer membrane biogenesis